MNLREVKTIIRFQMRHIRNKAFFPVYGILRCFAMGLSDYLGKFWYSSEPMFGVIMVVWFTFQRTLR
jgi:hypothetical protein